MPEKPSLLLDSITDAGETARGQVIICGSHGGMYPAALASHAGVRAVLFNDAGIGLDRAGIAGVMALAKTGMAAAAVDCQSCHIGSAVDMMERGCISAQNTIAEALGIRLGMAVAHASKLLVNAPPPTGQLPPAHEARTSITLTGTNISVELLDSASLVTATDVGKILITGSHGALIGGDPKRALKAAGRIGVFNDAGFGAENIGITRLPALDAQGTAAVTVSCETARIGDAASALETGTISACNECAHALGAETEMLLKTWLTGLSDPAIVL